MEFRGNGAMGTGYPWRLFYLEAAMTDQWKRIQEEGLYRPEFEHDNCGIGAIADIVAADAMAHHPEIFGRQPNPNAMQIDRIKEYIKRAIWEGKPQEPP